MDHLAFSFHGIYINEKNQPFTIAGNALVIPADNPSNQLNLDYIFSIYWLHNFHEGKDLGSYEVILVENNNTIQIGTIVNKNFQLLQNPFLDWLKDLIEKRYLEEKANPSQVTLYAPDFFA